MTTDLSASMIVTKVLEFIRFLSEIIDILFFLLNGKQRGALADREVARIFRSAAD